MSRQAAVEQPVWEQILNRVWEQACNHVETPVLDLIDGQATIRIREQVGTQTVDWVRHQVWDQAWDQVCEQAKEETNESTSIN